MAATLVGLSWLLWVWFASTNRSRRTSLCHLHGHSRVLSSAQFWLPFLPSSEGMRIRPQSPSVREGPPLPTSPEKGCGSAVPASCRKP